MRVGIVGHGADKFVAIGEARARALISKIISDALDAASMDGESVIVVSGHSPVGGVDIWAEEEATLLGVSLDLKIPNVNMWDPPGGGYGFKARNLDIAKAEIVHVILSDAYPPGYRGRRFSYCYHCKTDTHLKSGACWTGRRAARAIWYFVPNE